MAWIRIPGRRFRNLDTGEELSRRQYDKLVGRIVGSYERKAKENKKENIQQALSRPARGRKKATTVEEVEGRVQAYIKSRPLKTINKRLLKTGHYAERINFYSYDDYLKLRDQANGEKAPNGQRLIFKLGIGVVGHDNRDDGTEGQIGATIFKMMSPKVKISEGKFIAAMDQFMEEKPYFVIDHYYMQVHFNDEYAQQRVRTKQKRDRTKRLKSLGLK